MSCPSIAFSNGVLMPVVGLGTWQSTDKDVSDSVRTALETGYRLIDTASAYGNEEVIGETIQKAIADGIVTREELFITTKAWTHELPPNKLEAALRESLRKLKLDYVDLYLAHMPTATLTDGIHLDIPVETIWKGFEAVYKLGLTKAIGVSNWNNRQILRVLKSGTIPVHNSQVELHLYFGQKDHQKFCHSHNIVVTSYATLGSPGRVNFKPDNLNISWTRAPVDLWDVNVKRLAEKYKKSPAQILLRYGLDRGVAVIPKSNNRIRVIENFQIFDFNLTPNDLAILESNKINHRLFLQDFMEGHPEDAFPKER